MTTALALLLAAVPTAVPPPAVAPPTVTAPAVTQQGQEMVDLFGRQCVEAALNSAPAHRLLDGHPEAARAMTADELGRVMPGTVATEGWITKTPHDAWGALWFAPAKRTCGVTVRAADSAGMEAALDTRLRRFYDTLGATVTQRPDETTAVGGVTVHRASWTVALGTHELAVIASFADQPIGAQQHLMTFTLLH